jgi:hypothetical protein
MTMDKQTLERRIASLTACLQPTALHFTYPSGKTLKIAYKADEGRFMCAIGANAYLYADDVKSVAMLVLTLGEASEKDPLC